MIGAELDCSLCDRMEWPDGFVPARTTREFDETTLPSGFTRDHATKRGVWAQIHVVSGTLKYQVGAPIHRDFLVEADGIGIIVPEVPHRVEAIGPVRFSVVFWHAAAAER